MSNPPFPVPTPSLDHVPFRIGIVGGMGPMAGVYLQELIIAATPATRDQDHFEVVCFTNPHVPERMRSLAEDGGRRYADAVRASAQLVARAGATHIVIPCNTAHARLLEIQRGVDAPIVDMIRLGLEELVTVHGRGRRVGLLATTGTIGEQVYPRTAADAVAEWVLPGPDDQAVVSSAILAVKVGRLHAILGDVLGVCGRLAARGAEVIVVGCTELSMCYDGLAGTPVPLVDPLRVVARHLVRLGTTVGRSEV